MGVVVTNNQVVIITPYFALNYVRCFLVKAPSMMYNFDKYVNLFGFSNK